jgi:predicted Zn-dependent peptidase
MNSLLKTAPMFFAMVSLLAAGEFELDCRYDSLPNGLKYLLVRDTNVAVASCRLYYFVGSLYEGPGTTGLSHMFEHMMFKGTKRLGTTDYAKEVPLMHSEDSLDAIVQARLTRGVGESDSTVKALRSRIFGLLDEQRKYIKKDEIWDIYQRNGGTNLNAWTTDEMTAYLVTLPKNKLELFYNIESDRMANPILREFYSEREVVTEERRMRYENVPLNRYWERLSALFYVANPYHNPTIGWMSDIRAYTRAKLENHVKHFYTPDNAFIVINGNINFAEVAAGLKSYFSGIPRANPPKQPVVTREPAPIGQTRFTDAADAQPRVDILFHVPGYPNPDLYQLDIIEGVLDGRSGALYKRLVTQTQLCVDAGAENSFRLLDGYFHVWAQPKEGVGHDTVEKILLEEVARVAKNEPTARELTRIKNGIRMNFVSELKSLEGLSDRLASFQALRSWRDVLDYPDQIAAVAPATVPVIAARYFDPSKATFGRLTKEAK